MNKAHITKWLCTDGKTWRVGDKKWTVFCDCVCEAEADRILLETKGFTVDMLQAFFDDRLLSMLRGD
jgi:hypothetical protein